MKYVIFLGDGMADWPCEALDGQTPLQRAHKPNMDRIARRGQLCQVRNVPDGMHPGSDTANMSAMGFDPRCYYSGRSPLEAVSMGIELADGDLSYRVNLVTLSADGPLENCTMLDYSAGEITTAEAAELIRDLAAALTDEDWALFAGKSYRHCLVWRQGPGGAVLIPPHDITNQPIAPHLPQGSGADRLMGLIEQSRTVLKDHPINRARRARGLNEAVCLWPWGEGTRPSLPALSEQYQVSGTVISAVDLVQGIGLCCGMSVVQVPGATGNLSSDLTGKGQAAIDALAGGSDYVYIHVEAPDECGHQGDAAGKITAIERIDCEIIEPVWHYLQQHREATGESYRLMVMPDHPTPLAIRTHSSDPVPCALFDSEIHRAGLDTGNPDITYCETAAAAAAESNPAHGLVEGHRLFARFINPRLSLY